MNERNQVIEHLKHQNYFLKQLIEEMEQEIFMDGACVEYFRSSLKKIEAALSQLSQKDTSQPHDGHFSSKYYSSPMRLREIS